MNPIIATYISKYLPLPIFRANNFASNRDRENSGRPGHRSDRSSPYGSRHHLRELELSMISSDIYPFKIINGASIGGNVPVGSGFSDPTRSQQGAVTWTHIFSPHMINEFIFGSNRGRRCRPYRRHDFPFGPGIHECKSGRSRGRGPAHHVYQFLQPGPTPGGPTKEHDVTFHWQDSISWNKGHHDLKFGADIRRVRNNFNFDFFNNGSL